jgi:hypothetical protein
MNTSAIVLHDLRFGKIRGQVFILDELELLPHGRPPDFRDFKNLWDNEDFKKLIK